MRKYVDHVILILFFCFKHVWIVLRRNVSKIVVLRVSLFHFWPQKSGFNRSTLLTCSKRASITSLNSFMSNLKSKIYSFCICSKHFNKKRSKYVFLFILVCDCIKIKNKTLLFYFWFSVTRVLSQHNILNIGKKIRKPVLWSYFKFPCFSASLWTWKGTCKNKARAHVWIRHTSCDGHLFIQRCETKSR